VYGSTVTLTAYVASVLPALGIPTGTVTFWDGSSSLGTGTLNGSGYATLTVSRLSVGNHDISASYDGTDFNPSSSSPVTETITPLIIDVSASAQDKVYDGGTSATGTVTPMGVLSGDDVQAVFSSADFSDKNVGTSKTVTFTGISLTGADSGNYVLSGTSTTATASITALLLDAAASSQNKTYDGSTTTSVSIWLSGIVGSDDVSASGTGNFGDANVGTGKSVTVSGITLSGADAANYSVASSASGGTADIYAKELSVNVSASDKTYDGTTSASVSLSLNGVVSGESVGVSSTGANFDGADAGAGKTVTVSGISLTGANASNYSIGSSANTTASINALEVTVSAVGQNKVYDGSTDATVTLTVSGALPGDTVNASYASAQFSDPNIDTGKTIYVTGITLDNNNYYVASSSTTATADITGEGG
jgi:hypothetical protein